MQLVTLNQLDQLTGILGIGGVTTSFQSMRPTHIVCWLELKERLVVRSVSDEVRVIFVGLFYGGVLTKAFQATIILFIEIVTRPVSAFDTEVVVTLNRQVTFPCARFKDTLCQGNTGRYTMSGLLMDSSLMISLDILFTSIQISNFCFASLHAFDEHGATDKRNTAYNNGKTI